MKITYRSICAWISFSVLFDSYLFPYAWQPASVYSTGSPSIRRWSTYVSVGRPASPAALPTTSPNSIAPPTTQRLNTAETIIQSSSFSPILTVTFSNLVQNISTTTQFIHTRKRQKHANLLYTRVSHLAKSPPIAYLVSIRTRGLSAQLWMKMMVFYALIQTKCLATILCALGNTVLTKKKQYVWTGVSLWLLLSFAI